MSEANSSKIISLLMSNKDIVNFSESDGYLFSLNDSEPGSKFFFKVKEKMDGEGFYIFERYPNAFDEPKSQLARCKPDEIAQNIEDWLVLLKAHNKVPIFPDPIGKNYQEDFYNEFVYDDPEGDIKPFDLITQIHLDNYLDKAIKFLELSEATIPEEKKPLLKSVIENCKTLKDNLTDFSRNKTREYMSKIWGGAQKLGLNFIKELMMAFAVDGTKNVIAQSGIPGKIMTYLLQIATDPGLPLL